MSHHTDILDARSSTGAASYFSILVNIKNVKTRINSKESEMFYNQNIKRDVEITDLVWNAEKSTFLKKEQ